MKTGLFVPEILLPDNVDMNAWSVIACDQFTSEIEYWKQLESFVGDKYSTLNLVLPEVYLNDNLDKRIEKINANIDEYLTAGILKTIGKGFILLDRKTAFVEHRLGLIAAIDLEEYEYSKKSSALIRSTEGTIEERIPPRLKIRKDAAVEFPHIMLLYDDENCAINEKLYKNRQNYKKVYDFDLNMGGGHIEGYFIEDTAPVIKAFEALLDEDRLKAKYGFNDKFLFAVGDGNHSLATAKTHWNNIKANLSEEEKLTHPARYALVEIVNVYDAGIYFEPIFRLVTGVNNAEFIKGLKETVKGKIGILSDQVDTYGEKGSLPETIISVDEYIKKYINTYGGEVDYIHGEDNLAKLVKETGGVGITFDKLDKSELFKYVSKSGSLPRKTFSMGEGVEKRYYLEGKKIK